MFTRHIRLNTNIACCGLLVAHVYNCSFGCYMYVVVANYVQQIKSICSSFDGNSNLHLDW